MSRTEIRITGFGGQGVVLSGYIIGRACAINAGKHATMIQSFGPEARGSACSATLALSDEEVLYPYIRRPDIFVVMSAEGYDKYRDELKPNGTLVYEKDLVQPGLKKGQRSFGVPSTRIAEALGASDRPEHRDAGLLRRGHEARPPRADARGGGGLGARRARRS